jgi:streptomycin 6-kinase
MFEPYLLRWGLVLDGDAIITLAAQLLPVLRSGEPAMLKLSSDEDERLGGLLMEWGEGEGAARVLARDDTTLLLDRATGSAFLADMACAGRDDACRILCATAARLHAPRTKPPPGLIPLTQWFQDLEPAAAK